MSSTRYNQFLHCTHPTPPTRKNLFLKPLCFTRTVFILKYKYTHGVKCQKFVKVKTHEYVKFDYYFWRDPLASFVVGFLLFLTWFSCKFWLDFLLLLTWFSYHFWRGFLVIFVVVLLPAIFDMVLPLFSTWFSWYFLSWFSHYL